MLERFQRITSFVFDIDGVLTNGNIGLPEGGLQERSMNIKDGYALQLAIKKGYKILVISGADSQQARERLSRLGLTDIHISVTDKSSLLKNYMKEHSFDRSQVLFMGDDIPDLPLMSIAGLGCAPYDAVSELRSAARYISRFKGGEGCVRDVIEKVLRLNGHWVMDNEIASK